ncbi:MAG: efflux RND transporter periplasmic adaptor subunit [Gemmatimonadales bacterium]
MVRTGTVALLAAMAVGCNKGKADAGAAAGAAPAAIPVEAAIAQRDTVIDAIAATGQVEAIQSIELKPDVEGRLNEILVREGTIVAKGASLFRIDDAELQAQVARAEAERDLAQQSLKRTRELLAQRASSQADLENAEATYRSSAASLDLLKVRLDRTTVRAPFAGIMGQRFVSVGDYVTTASRLASLQTVDPTRAVFQVPERYATSLQKDQRITFQVAALQGRQFVGRVDFVDPVVQLPARTITVKALVSNPKGELRPGMFVEVRLETAVRPNAVVIPEDAILALQQESFAWVVVEGKATRRVVSLGVRTPGFVEITDGVREGEQVVVGGVEKMSEGAPVAAKVVERTRRVRTDSAAG